MQNRLVKILNPQALKIYQLLDKYSSLTPKLIGKKLQILPNAVYREGEKLEALGLIQKSQSRPVEYLKKQPEESLSLIMQLLKQSFFDNGSNEVNSLKINFIQKRKELIKFTTRDTNKAKNSFNFIVSGHEVPAETIFRTHQAIKRGVRTRALVQKVALENREMLKNWKKLGIEVKYFPFMESRVFVFDSRVAYFTSFNPNQVEEAIGVRFDYAPYAQLMNELFEQRWAKAKDISDVK